MPEAAALRVETGLDELSVVITTDRTSNGPVLTYPAPSAPGGAPRQETWVLDHSPLRFVGRPVDGGHRRTSRGRGRPDRERLDEVTLLRYEQYQAALADDRAFQRRYMVPVTLPARRGEPVVIDSDVGVHPTTAEGLAKLAPAEPGGVVTYGTQTHPADGTAGLVVTTAARARNWPAARGSRASSAPCRPHQPRRDAPRPRYPAALAALEQAGLGSRDVDAVTTHNPFAVNDLWFSQQTGIAVERMNATAAA